MLTLSLNEYEDAEKYLEDKICDKEIYNKLRVIARYYIDNGYDRNSTEEKLREFISQCGEVPSLNYWSDMIEKSVKKAIKTKAILINSISIYKSELDKINNLVGAQVRRLAFTLLCLEKYRDALIKNNNHWVTYSMDDVVKLANIKTSIKNRCLLYRKLMLAGLIVLPEKAASTSVQVLLADKCGDEVLQITDMRNLGYQYLKYMGGSYFECECCGLTVKRRPGEYHHQKYCDQCAALMRAKQNAESVRRLRMSS